MSLKINWRTTLTGSPEEVWLLSESQIILPVPGVMSKFLWKEEINHETTEGPEVFSVFSKRISFKSDYRESNFLCPWGAFNVDGLVKSPSVRLMRIVLHLRRCSGPCKYASLLSPARSGTARLASKVFYLAIPILTFYEITNLYRLLKKYVVRPTRRTCLKYG